MAIAQSRITGQGQISVPKPVRDRLGVGPGSTLEWTEHDGDLVVRRAGKYTSEDIHAELFASKTPKSRSLAEMKAGIRRRMRNRYGRD